MGNTPSESRAPTFCDIPLEDGKPAPQKTYAKYEGDGPFFTCKPEAVMPLKLADTCLASANKCKPITFPKLLNNVKEINGSRVAFMVERPLPPLDNQQKAPPALPLNEWRKWTYAQYFDSLRDAAKGLAQLGFARYDSLNIWGFNSPEWILGSLAASFAGGKVAGIYPTDTDETAAYKIVHSGGSVVLVEDKAKMDKALKGLQTRGDAKRLKAIVIWAPSPESVGNQQPSALQIVEVPGCGCVRVLTWDDMLKLGRTQGSDQEIDGRVEQTEPGNCAALIYTSGTTGQPKAVMISHDNIIYEATTVRRIIKQSAGFGVEGEERILSYLPLSHVAGMMVDIIMPAVVSSSENTWCVTYFARPYDLKVGSIKDRLCAAKPTVFLGVPLVWEKIADKVRAIGAANTGIKAHLGAWAKGKAVRNARSQQLGAKRDEPWTYFIAKKLLSKVAEGLGMDELKFGFTGAAPIRVDTLEYFGSIGIPIYEVYGMSECTGAATLSCKEAHIWGSCGWPLPGVELGVFKVDERDPSKKIKCEEAPDVFATDEKYMGEVCWRGRNNMMGYMANSDLGADHVAEIEKKTAECIDAQGWLHSGDKGMLTTSGLLKITGRYKELIIGDGGENIAPVPIEDSIKKLCDGVNEVMMVGDKRKYNVALITLKAVGANGEVPGTDQLDAGAKRLNPDTTTISAAMDDERWIEAITTAITKTNKDQKVCLNNAYTVQKFTILPTNFSEEGNELTPTKKLKRKNVEDKYKAVVDKLYASESKGPYVHF